MSEDLHIRLEAITDKVYTHTETDIYEIDRPPSKGSELIEICKLLVGILFKLLGILLARHQFRYNNDTLINHFLYRTRKRILCVRDHSHSASSPEVRRGFQKSTSRSDQKAARYSLSLILILI